VKIQIDKLKGKCLEIRSLFVLLLIVSAGLCFSGRNAGAQDPSKTPPQAQGQRTNRSQAYLKLLEGQRYYSGISEGDADTKLKAAEAAFKEAIALNPDLIEAHAALAEVSFYLQNFDQTISEAQAAIKLSPDNLGAHKVLSRVYSIKSGLREANPDPKAVELAVAELKEVVRIDKDNSEGWALLGDFYHEQGKTDEAIDAYKHWSTSPPSSDKHFFQIFTQGRDLSPDAAFARLADTLIAAGRAREGVAAARQALAANPENKEYGELLGRALEAEGGDSPKVIAELQNLLAQNPGNASLAIALSHAQARAGDIDAAAKTLKDASSKKGLDSNESRMLRVELAQTYGDAARFAEAIEIYETLLKDRQINEAGVVSADNRRYATVVFQRIVAMQKSADEPAEALETVERMRKVLGPGDPTADREYIGILKEQGKRQEALDAAKAASEKFPADVELLRLQGDALTSLGRVDEAAGLMKARLKGNINDFTTFLLISNFYMDAGKGKEAVEYANKALAIVPTERTDLAAIALTSLASAQERAGDAAGAEQSLRKVLKDDPKNSTVMNNLGYFLAERNERLDEAIELIQKALKQDPGNASFMDSLGWAFFKQGKMSEAEKYLTDAARRSHSSAAIQEHLGDLYSKQQQKEKAVTAFRRAKNLAVDKVTVARIGAKLDALGK